MKNPLLQQEHASRPAVTEPPEDPLTAPFAQCFAKVPHHPDFGLPRPMRHLPYTPGMIQNTYVFLTYTILNCNFYEKWGTTNC